MNQNVLQKNIFATIVNAKMRCHSSTGMGGAGGPGGVLEWADSGVALVRRFQSSAHSSVPILPGADGVGALEWALIVNEFSVVTLGESKFAAKN